MRIRIACLVLLAAFIVLSSCATRKASRITKMIQEGPVLSDHFTGFILTELGEKKPIIAINESKYFTPASNTKLYTFYACLNILGDSIPALQVEEGGDSLFFWGTGDPTFLHPQLNNPVVYRFLQNNPRRLFFVPGRYTGDFYGTGWQYDDYNGYYQPEITEFPLYENCLHLSGSPKGLHISPPAMRKALVLKKMNGGFTVRRTIFGNEFYHPDTLPPASYSQVVPMRMDLPTIVTLLADTLKRPVGQVERKLPAAPRTIYSIASDTLYRHMLQPSDNFMAEQLLLLCAVAAKLEMNTDTVIAYVKRKYLADLPDDPKWADGSGLSRMDLFTPRDMIALLQKIYDKVNDRNRLFGLLAIGGKAGTLKNVYKSANPFVFGKTGSLSNNYNQSGYILTKKGKVLMYSFMNNNFTAPVSSVRSDMEKVVTWVYEHY